MKYLGTILPITAITMMTFAGFNTPVKESVTTTGHIKIEKEKTPVSWSPVAGAGCFVTGFLIVDLDKKS